MDQIEVFEFDSGKEGEHLLVLGAIHGDEICGPQAIKEIIDDIENNRLKIEKGRVTFIPVCNPEAYKQNQRYIDRNLNRYFFPKDKIEVYEDGLTNQICPYLKNSDVLLDLHSYKSGGPAFVFIEKPEGDELAFANALYPEFIVYGWSDSYKNLTEDEKKMGIGDTDYMREQGGVGITYECGQHLDPQSPVNARRAIENAMTYLEIAEFEKHTQRENRHPKLIKVMHPIMKPKEGRFAKNWKNFEFVEKGTLFGTFEDGEEVRILEDGVLILPKESSSVGSEWSYLGKVGS